MSTQAAEDQLAVAKAAVQKAQEIYDAANRTLQEAQKALSSAKSLELAAIAELNRLRKTENPEAKSDRYADAASREEATIASIRDVFYRMGFEDREIVALVGGGHAYGRCHPANSGYAGPWVQDPTKFSNEFCADLLQDEWAEITSETPGLGVGMCPVKGKRQFNNQSGKGPQMMLISDMCMLWDSKFREHLQVYSEDSEALKRDFGLAFKKLTELGFPEDAPQAAESDLLSAKEAIKSILSQPSFDDGSLGPILIRLAWHSSGTYDKATGTGGSNGATMRFEPESTDPDNAGLGRAREFLEAIAVKHPNLSRADLWALAGYVAIAESGGPIIPFRSGRVDKRGAGMPNGRLPAADKGVSKPLVKAVQIELDPNKKLVLLHLHHHFTAYFSQSITGSEAKADTQDHRDMNAAAQAVISATSAIPHEDRHQHLFHRQHNDIDNAEAKKVDSGDRETIARVELEMLARPEYNHPDLKVHVVNHVYRVFKNVDLTVTSSAINDVQSLQEHLRWAMRLELAAIPTYLFAMYSMKDKEHTGYKLLLSIAVEEMLHAALAANLLMAVGGTPSFYDPSSMPRYPLQGLPGCESIRLTLAPLSEQLLTEVLLPLEAPCAHTPPPEPSQAPGNYATVRAFYTAIEGGLARLARADPHLFDNARPELQMKPHNYKIVKMNAAESGGVQVVSDLKSARVALDYITNHGEGSDGIAEAKELAHYHKLLQLKGLQMGEVYPCAENPHTEQFSPSLQIVSNAFNASYSLLMLTLNEMYQDPDKGFLLHNRMYALMEGCMRPTAQFLCANPVQSGSLQHAGPTFEPFVFSAEPATQVMALMQQVLELPSFAQDTVVVAKVKKNLVKLKK